MPGDRWLTEEEQAPIREHIVERRKDREFMERLDRRMEEDLPLFECMAGEDEPLRLWRRARAWLRPVFPRRRGDI